MHGSLADLSSAATNFCLSLSLSEREKKRFCTQPFLQIYISTHTQGGVEVILFIVYSGPVLCSNWTTRRKAAMRIVVELFEKKKSPSTSCCDAQHPTRSSNISLIVAHVQVSVPSGIPTISEDPPQCMLIMAHIRLLPSSYIEGSSPAE